MGHPRRLTPEAEAAFAAVVDARALQRSARQAAETAAKLVLEAGTRETDRALGAALRTALAAGVPATRLHREGLGTTDFNTLERFTSLPQPTAVA